MNDGVIGSVFSLVYVSLKEEKRTNFFPTLLCLSLEKAMAPHSSTLAWKIPWTEEPGRLQSMR